MIWSFEISPFFYVSFCHVESFFYVNCLCIVIMEVGIYYIPQDQPWQTFLRKMWSIECVKNMYGEIWSGYRKKMALRSYLDE